ncbi:M20/M25/M40 family metallo-hydrolase [Clavibacter phaseoli]|uniref:M20/M25/M40 family metallo-hydrolase n=1 Tax=Clavibacter phaseoli TaxID=1734031 RepID=UPI000E671188|nr:M20/M25/M40 family metallo-hydrolase [Clavibacter phaseoli]RIJ54975.1 M20/M25/M40 family metallo-hydrolase [Clavibacter phaseoli]UKF30770.1 M20/M25/M40 family metallo-hydrolase [Clavibacter phaseoli]UKF36688.1 M20/M25/M40 family metallo-hydrolase [Clavibacter phaseoli]
MSGAVTGPDAGVAGLVDPVDLAAELIRIDSTNPDLVTGAAGETAVAAHVAAWLRARGFDVRVLEDVPGRPTVLATARGTGGGRTILLDGHLDTVPPGDPARGGLAPLIEEGRLLGRGAFDMKAGLAAMMVAADRARRIGTRGDVVLALVADEEFGSIGTEEALRALAAAGTRIDGAVISEPSQSEAIVAHRGFGWYEIRLTGRAAHGSMPEQGVDAIAHAGLVLRELDALAERLAAGPRHPLLGTGAVRVSRIHGGSDAATVADSCVLTVERRFLPGQSTADVEAELRAALTAVAARTPGMVAELEALVARAAFEADVDGPLARAVLDSGARVTGSPVPHRGEPFWTDAGLVLEAGIPCILLGVTGGGAHADEEWAEVDSIRRLADVLEGAILDFCGTAGA